MKDEKQTKKQLIEELAKMHQRAAELSAAQSELKQADKLLRKSEERFRTQYQNIPIPTYTWQRAGDDFILVDYNKAGASMTKGTISDLKGVKASDLYNDQPEIVADFSRCFDERTVIKKEMPYRLKTTGENKHLAVTYAFVPPDLVLVHTEDITSRKQAENALKQSEQRFRAVLDAVPDLMLVLDAEGRYRQIFTSDSDLLYAPVDQLLDKTVHDVLPPEDAQQIQEIIDWVLAEGELQKYDYAMKTGGLERWFAGRVTKFKFQNSDCVLWCARDITERKRMEEALSESEAELTAQAHHLEEVNAALKVLLKQRENDKADLEQRILANVKELVMPYVERLKNSRLNSQQMTLLGILESNIKEIVSPFSTTLSSRFLNLTPTEIQVASLIKDGKTSKEIAVLLNASENTVRSHRTHIRSKLGIKNRKVNMRSYLKSLHDK